jgi:hypothetical protein
LNGIRALAVLVAAATLSIAGPGAVALARTSEPERLTRQGGDGKDEAPLVARPAASAARVLARPRSSSHDDLGGRTLAGTLAARARGAAAVSQRFLSGRAPRCNPRRFPLTVRSSRGPPEG